MSRRARAAAANLALLPWLAACAGFAPPSAATAARLRPMALADAVPGRCELEIESPGLNGAFDAVVAVDECAVRLQVFPDVGGKLIDLRIDADAMTADIGGAAYRASPPYGDAEPGIALVLGAIVGELATPVTPERLRGERRRGDAVEVLLAAGRGGSPVRATLAADGRVATMAWHDLRVPFRLHADGTFSGPGFRGRIAPAPR